MSDQQPQINITMTNANTANAGQMNKPSLFMRILWLLIIGWYAGLIWLCAMAIFAVTIIGLPFAAAMAKYLSTAFYLGRVNW